MRLYDENIHDLYELLEPYQPKHLMVSLNNQDWTDVGSENMILRSDMAYELGGGTLAALSGLAVTADPALVPEDEVLLYGPDLPEIHEDIPYARIAIARVRADSLGEGNTLYNAIRKIEYVRYHLNPKGYMMRISASNQREPVRIGRDALEQGLDFTKAGQMFLQAYHENPNMEAVKLLYITQPDFPYKELEGIISKNERITATVDHIMKDVVMDCKACNLKPICDEVEGMKELHFAQLTN